MAEKSTMGRDTMGQRIKQAREALGMSQEALAEVLHVTQPTVWEWENEVSQPRRKRVKTIATALRKSPDWIERGDVSVHQEYEIQTVKIPIIGTVQAGAWMEAYQLPEGEWETMHLPLDARFPGVPRYGLKANGPSVNRIVDDGGVLIYVRYDDLGAEPQPNQYVIVERRRPGTVEATCKLLKADKSGKLWLWPDSTDPRHQTPLPLDGDADTDEIIIIGRVIKTVKDL